MKPVAVRVLKALSLTAMAVFTPFSSAQVMQHQPAPVRTPKADYGKLPLSFEANQGQTDSSVQFLSRGPGYTVYLRPQEAVLALSDGESSASAVHLRLAGANASAKSAPEDQQITRTNYLIGSDPAKWHSDIPNYSRVRYSSVYPGIDLVYYGNQRQLEHDFIVAPNADPCQIVFTVDGNSRTTIDRTTGDLVLATTKGEVRLLKPVTYQLNGGKRSEVSSQYKLLARNKVGFSLGSYQRSQPLVIDPVLSYSTFFGSSGFTVAYGIDVDSAGEAFITGETSPILPTTSGAFQSVDNDTSSDNTAFVSKLSSDGSTLIYSTYLGGSGRDYANAIAVDAAGDAYVAGLANSTDFPVTSGAFQTTNKSRLGALNAANCFVAKLNPTGTHLEYSTYLGGSVGDSCNTIKVDSSGSAYVGGATQSSDFPVTAGAFQTALGHPNGQAGFAAKLNATGSSLDYATYLGGSTATGLDQVNALAIDSSGDLFLTGSTSSLNFPVTAGAYQTVNPGNQMAFVTELNPAGNSLVYSTLLGVRQTQNQSIAYGIALDAANNAYVAGVTTDPLQFPTTAGAYQTTGLIANRSGFVTKVNPTGTSLVYSTLLAGTGNFPSYSSNGMRSIAVDASGNAYVIGTTDQPKYPVTANAVQKNNDSGYVYNGAAGNYLLGGLPTSVFTVLNPTGTALVYSTYLGGAYSTVYGEALALDGSGNAYLVGDNDTHDFPHSTGAYQPAFASNGSSSFVTRIGLESLSTGTGTIIAVGYSSASSVPVQGIPVTFTAHVASVGSNAIPTGNVSFAVNGSVASEEALNADGVATYTTNNLPTYGTPIVVTANYEGSETSDFSAGGVLLSVLSGLKLETVSRDQSTVYGTPFKAPITVQLYSVSGFPIATSGIPITFSGPGLQLSTSTALTDANGLASINVSPESAGQFVVTASVGAATPATFHLTVTKATLHIVANALPTTYGQAPPQPTSYHLTGFVNGDTAAQVSGAPALSTTVTASTPVGFYLINVGVGTLSSQNYNFVTTSNGPGYVGVYKAHISVRSNTITVKQGDPIPPLTYTLTGFVNGDTASVVTGAPVLTTTATSSSPPGSYGITTTVGTLSSPNYGFVAVQHGGGLYITK